MTRNSLVYNQCTKASLKGFHAIETFPAAVNTVNFGGFFMPVLTVLFLCPFLLVSLPAGSSSLAETDP